MASSQICRALRAPLCPHMHAVRVRAGMHTRPVWQASNEEKPTNKGCRVAQHSQSKVAGVQTSVTSMQDGAALPEEALVCSHSWRPSSPSACTHSLLTMWNAGDSGPGTHKQRVTSRAHHIAVISCCGAACRRSQHAKTVACQIRPLTLRALMFFFFSL